MAEAVKVAAVIETVQTTSCFKLFTYTKMDAGSLFLAAKATVHMQQSSNKLFPRNLILLFPFSLDNLFFLDEIAFPLHRFALLFNAFV